MICRCLFCYQTCKKKETSLFMSDHHFEGILVVPGSHLVCPIMCPMCQDKSQHAICKCLFCLWRIATKWAPYLLWPCLLDSIYGWFPLLDPCWDPTCQAKTNIRYVNACFFIKNEENMIFLCVLTIFTGFNWAALTPPTHVCFPV